MSDGPRVLVVDDDPQLRGALSRALELDGYDVSTASNGVKALDAISASRPDVMVLDVMMPYVGGLDVCRTLRERKDRLPILVLTAEASYHAPYDHCTVRYLEQAGVKPTAIRLVESGIRGNSHVMMLEKNNKEIAAVIEMWLQKTRF